MDGWLKALIAAACVVVIAGGGYLGWSEWSRASAQAGEQATIEAARSAILNESGAAAGTAAARQWCETMKNLARGELRNNDIARLRVAQCRLLGM